MNLEKEIQDLKKEIAFLKQVMFTKAEGEAHYKKNKKRIYDYFKVKKDGFMLPPPAIIRPPKLQRMSTLSAEVLNKIPDDLIQEISEQNDINDQYLLTRGITSIIN